MSEADGLFGNLADQAKADPGESGLPAVRLRVAQRDQPEFQVVDLDSLLAVDHPARAVWAFVAALDLSEVLASIKARAGEPGRPPADPKILMAPWLYATIEAVGSARALAELCAADVAYRWICGGVSMNHHTLADFRVSQVALLDRLLAQGVASLVSEGLVTLQCLAQDGVRIRASAGSTSYRRRARLERLLADAETRVVQLKAELEADPAASMTRQRAARQRAAREQVERTQAALERLKQLEAQRAQRQKTHKADTARQKEPRASTTDAEARVMKLADGGYRPAYNGQFASDPQTQVVVAVGLDTTGSDLGQMAPMQAQIAETYGQTPQQYLVDGGFSRLDDIEQAHDAGIEVFAPPPNNKHGTDPFAPRQSDGPGTLAWRKRMSSEAGKLVYRQRSKHECVNAHLRNCGVVRLLVRGKQKVRAVLLWYAVAHNLLRALALRAAPADAAARG
ncbi:MAG TPA: IS1182 family transposase [Acetobacteraceae bacterium]|nr:IS1182 family transposase [Acetobacteraceae bacterium]